MSHRFRTTNPNSPAARARKAEYNSPHYRQAGKQAARQVQTGKAHCWRCNTRIPPSAKRGPDWQLGHHDTDRSRIMGPECTPCNRRAAAREGNRKQRIARGKPYWVRRTVRPLDL